MKNYHVVTSSIIFLTMVVILFSNNNPVIVASVYIYILAIILLTDKRDRFKIGIMYFLPIAVLIILINMFFVTAGRITLFYVFNKKVTLETAVYGAIMAFKLLAVIYLFMILEDMIDSDKAVSYFSSKMPKSTLMLMISFKLIPSMIERFKNLKEIYKIRGVKFNKKKSKENTSSYVPVLSVLLEDSLEGSFTIGEAAYVRGFLSGHRSVYERQKFYFRDYNMIVLNILLIVSYCIAKIKGLVNFDIYNGVTPLNFINMGIACIFSFIVAITTIFAINSTDKN